MEHKSRTAVSGGKDVVNRDDILKKLFEVIDIKLKVKGYKSSEGDKVFEPPREAGTLE